MEDVKNVYRITILYMLDNLEYPLTNTDITNFILEKDYTDYFSIQQIIGDLQESGLIFAKNTHSNTMYYMTDEGTATLRLFENKLSQGIKDDVMDYFNEHRYEIKQKTSIFADYYKASPSGFNVKCDVKESGHDVLSITVHVDNQEQAMAMCGAWNDQCYDIYAEIMDRLLK